MFSQKVALSQSALAYLHDREEYKRSHVSTPDSSSLSTIWAQLPGSRHPFTLPTSYLSIVGHCRPWLPASIPVFVVYLCHSQCQLSFSAVVSYPYFGLAALLPRGVRYLGCLLYILYLLSPLLLGARLRQNCGSTRKSLARQTTLIPPKYCF